MKAFFMSSLYILLSLALSLHSESPPQAASCLDLGDTSGSQRNTCEKNGKRFLITEFFSPTCSHCRANASEFKKLELEIKDFAHTRLISLGSLPHTLSFLDSYAISTETVLDTSREAMNAYGITHVPTLVVVDENNSIVHRYTGVLSAEEINVIKGLVSQPNNIFSSDK